MKFQCTSSRPSPIHHRTTTTGPMPTNPQNGPNPNPREDLNRKAIPPSANAAAEKGKAKTVPYRNPPRRVPRSLSRSRFRRTPNPPKQPRSNVPARHRVASISPLNHSLLNCSRTSNNHNNVPKSIPTCSPAKRGKFTSLRSARRVWRSLAIPMPATSPAVASGLPKFSSKNKRAVADGFRRARSFRSGHGLFWPFASAEHSRMF
jgi:hypothetical protein